MPKVKIAYDRAYQEYAITEGGKYTVIDDPEWEAIIEMKSSHFRNMQRNIDRYNKDQQALMNFFMEAQMRGREIRER